MENKNLVPKRQIIIETDGITVNLAKIEVTSFIEFKAILDMLQEFLSKEMAKAKENSEKEPKKEEKVEKSEEKVVESAK